jgi:hypothetical protein
MTQSPGPIGSAVLATEVLLASGDEADRIADSQGVNLARVRDRRYSALLCCYDPSSECAEGTSFQGTGRRRMRPADDRRVSRSGQQTGLGR